MKCITCSVDKPESEFKKVRGNGLGRRCFSCREKVSRSTKAFYENNPNYKDQKPQPYWYDPEVRREKVYGLSPNAYQKMLTEQDGACAICRKKSKLVVDHCHATGKTRQLLCSACNTGIGHLREDVAILEAAIAYIKAHKG